MGAGVRVAGGAHEALLDEGEERGVIEYGRALDGVPLDVRRYQNGRHSKAEAVEAVSQ